MRHGAPWSVVANEGESFYYHGKLVGRLHKGLFVKHVRESLHLFRKLNAWAIDKETWESVRGRVRAIAVVDSDTGRTYIVEPEVFERYATTIEYAADGAQRALPRSYWTVLKEEPRGNP